jgi:predicted amidohydrolase YtcJ
MMNPKLIRPNAPTYLLTRGRIVSMDDDNAIHEAILLRDGLVAWVGRSSDAPPADHCVDLSGATVIPGLTDAHLHLLAVAQENLQLRLDDPGIESIADVARTLTAAAARGAPGEWVIASGFNEARLVENRLLTAADLDAAVPDRSVVVRRFCGHLAIANSRALAAAGVGSDTADPDGGSYEREGGKLTGVLRELAADHMFVVAPKPSTERLGARIRELAQGYLSYGITSFCEAAVGFTNGFDHEWRLWEYLRAQGSFPLRASFMLRISPEEAATRGLTPGGIDRDWQVRTLKFFADGIVGARTAVFFEPYHDCPGCGAYITPPEELDRDFAEAHRDGWQIAVHTIGDRAIEQVIRSLEAAVRPGGSRDRRHRIEHLAFPRGDAVARVKKAGISVVTQYGFLHNMGDSFIAAVGPRRASEMYFGRSLLDAGITVAGSSDGPTGPQSPFRAMATAVLRRTRAGVPVAPQESISLQEAVRIYSRGGARCMHHEHWRGMLKPGYVADLAVLDTDVLNAEPEAIVNAKAVMTFVRGVPVYDER